jgi:hypothetical protein
MVNDWLKAHRDAAFDQPAAFSRLSLRPIVFALQVNALADNHDRLFKAIHDNGKQFSP